MPSIAKLVVKVPGKAGTNGGTLPASTDGAMASNSDGKLPTEKAVVTYVGAKTLISGFTTGAAIGDSDTFGINQGAGNLKQTFAAIKTWITNWLASAALTWSGKTLTTPTINGAAVSGTWSGNPAFTGNVTAANLFGNPGFTLTATQTAIRNTGGDTIIELGRIDNVASNNVIDFHTGTDGTNDFDSRILASGGTASDGQGTISVTAASFQWNASPIMTRGAAETKTGLLTLSVGNSTANTSFLSALPSDYGTNKPGLFLIKSGTAQIWNVDIWDGSSNAGNVNFNSGSVPTHNGVALARVDGPIFTLPPRLPSYTVATVPSAATYVRGEIYVSNEAGGATPAFSDGTNWRRDADRAIIS